MEKRYTALRIVGTIYKILGIIVLALSIIAVIALCAGGALGGAAMQRSLRGLDFGVPGMGMFAGAGAAPPGH